MLEPCYYVCSRSLQHTAYCAACQKLVVPGLSVLHRQGFVQDFDFVKGLELFQMLSARFLYGRQCRCRGLYMPISDGRVGG